MLANRQQAGRALAAKLLTYKNENPVILALPRGGVPVAAEIAGSLEAPLDVILVHKIGAPYQPELAIGAVVGGAQPETLVDDEVMALVHADRDYVAAEAARQFLIIERRETLYRRGRSPESVTGRTAILVDDGIATGWTMRAAIRAVRRSDPTRIIVAVPVAAPQALADLRAEVDGVVCLEAPEYLGSIGQFYRDFTQVGDDEVIALLARGK